MFLDEGPWLLWPMEKKPSLLSSPPTDDTVYKQTDLVLPFKLRGVIMYPALPCIWFCMTHLAHMIHDQYDGRERLSHSSLILTEAIIKVTYETGPTCSNKDWNIWRGLILLSEHGSSKVSIVKSNCQHPSQVYGIWLYLHHEHLQLERLKIASRTFWMPSFYWFKPHPTPALPISMPDNLLSKNYNFI